jgi:EAL domain-containing protein (putative c-di-GMP-specific phosphodiesterase class I)
MRPPSDKRLRPTHVDRPAARRPDGYAPTIFLQPIVDLATGQAVAAEALARFPASPTFAVDEVFATAHAAGRGAELEATCLRAARARHADLPSGVLLAVNVSPDALDHPDVLGALAGSLRGLIVEVTEQPATRPETTLEHLGRLRRRGALIAVDDVGTGYAGLMRLAQLRPDIIKVDRNVVAHVAGSLEQTAVIEALVSLGRRLGSLILAEGVERTEDLGTLGALDVDYAQGWAIGPPAPRFEPIAPAVVAACRDARDGLLRVDPPPTPFPGGRLPDLQQVSIALGRAARRTQFDTALAAAAESLGATGVGVSVLTEEHTLRDIAASGTHPDRAEHSVEHLPATAATLRRGAMLETHVDDPGTDPAERAVLRRRGIASRLLVPLFVDGVPIGVLRIEYARRHRLSAHDITRARRLGEHIAHTLARLA